MAVAGVGFLSSTVSLIRSWIDEPDVDRFTDAAMLANILRAYADVLEDVNRVSTDVVRSRVDIAVVANQREYVLPPTVGRIVEFARVDTYGNIIEEAVPRGYLSGYGPNWTIEGPILRFDPVWQVGQTLRLTHIPNGEVAAFEGTVAAGGGANGAITASTLTPPSTLTAGTLDRRANAYVGYVLRVLSENGGTAQDRVVTAQDSTTPSQPVFTVKPDFSPTPTVSVVFELVPSHAYRFQHLVALKVARLIAGVIGDRLRYQTLAAEYTDAMRHLMLSKAQAEGRVGQRMHRHVRGRGRIGKVL